MYPKHVDTSTLDADDLVELRDGRKIYKGLIARSSYDPEPEAKWDDD